jgi:hypothetical protein
MIQIRNTGFAFSVSDEELKRMRDQFGAKKYILLPLFLAAGFLQVIRNKIARAKFFEKVHGDSVRLSVEHCMENNAATAALHLAVNSPEFFQFIQRATGCGRIGCFEGRVYRMVPGQNHYDSWHNDVKDGRILAMSINLSTGVYEGGVLQIRDRESGQVLQEVANTGPGDAIIFRISPTLQHRLTDVTGTEAKTAFAGWFKPSPKYQVVLMESLKQLRNEISR